MQNQLQVFQSPEFGSVRTVEIDGDPWFVGKDVASALGYQNQSKAIADHVEDDDKLNNTALLSLGQRGGWLINESGLYSMVMSSQMPTAKAFKRWITKEVIPSIRKTGQYSLMPKDYPAALRALADETEKRMALEAENAVQAQQIAEMSPKVSYYDLVLQSNEAIPISVIGKDYGVSGYKMNIWLEQRNIQFRRGPKGKKIWLLHQKYAEKGYTVTKTFCDENGTHIHTYWRQSGRLFIYDLLKKDGILPLIERVQ